ncbi:hypothetical protein CROQUDRAFT_665921 [Cronartium quercuum f. sp. fusiforme G11]|uniref:AN1-type domain-containing protein n=1 Tax=Cronartium quercuum f. sp. fusiforme G11 TaxID=708437 RepID=A0A9P6N5S2_9BASI|nr:hypothetical protein CROQUDRAFT_665921 [Cronartium quercuum f. sp. fusiforme G11]
MTVDDDHHQNALFTTGRHCSQTNCNTLDFLPLVCVGCQSTFCKDHSPVFYHDCPSIEAQPERIRPPPTHQGSSDVVKDLIASHNPSSSDSNSPSSAQLERSAKAKQILDKHLPKQSSSTSSSVLTSSAVKKKPLSPAVQLILLRKKAKCGDPRKKEGDVPLNERWYGTLQCSVSGQVTSNQSNEEGRPIWFSKKTITGKVFDLVTESFRPQIGSILQSELQLCVFCRSTSESVILSDKCSSNWGELVHDNEEVWLMRKS